jgi:hypothetical protein
MHDENALIYLTTPGTNFKEVAYVSQLGQYFKPGDFIHITQPAMSYASKMSCLYLGLKG